MKNYLLIFCVIVFSLSTHAQVKNCFTLQTYSQSANYYDIVSEANNYYSANPDPDEEGGENQFRRWEWFWQNRVDSRDINDRGKFSNAIK